MPLGGILFAYKMVALPFFFFCGFAPVINPIEMEKLNRDTSSLMPLGYEAVTVKWYNLPHPPIANRPSLIEAENGTFY